MTITAAMISGHLQSSVAAASLNNTFSPSTFSLTSGGGAKFPIPGAYYYVVVWDSVNYTNPSDDPNYRIGVVIKRSGDVLTAVWGQLGTDINPLSGTPAIAYLWPETPRLDTNTTISRANGFNVTVGQSNANYVCNGDNDDVEIQAAVDAVAAAGGGQVFIKSGTYSINNTIKPRSYVRILGESMWTTRLVATSNITSTAIIGDTSFTPANPLVGFSCAQLELDGINMPRGTYQIGQKGIDSHNLQYCTFEYLYIHDVPASGLGVDNLWRVLIDHVYTKNCGTFPTPSGQGSNGIGLGIGGNTHESFIVTNCITENTANSGYLAENLESVTDSQAMYIFANNISINDYTGFSLSGAPNVTVVNNQIYTPQNIGIRGIDFVTHYTVNSTIKNNLIIGAVNQGIYFDTHSTNFTIEGNTVKDGQVEGILVRGSKGIIANNNVHDNGKHGIFLGGGSGGLTIQSINIVDNLVTNNSKVTANSDGIRLDGANVSITDITITGNRCYDDQGTKTQRYGIILSGGTGHSNINISNNNVRNNKTGGYLKSSFTGTAIAVRNNDGANPDYFYAQGNVTGATTFNRQNGSLVTATLTGNITVTMTSGINEGDILVMELTQDATGSRTVTWPANFKKVGGTLALSTAAGAVDIVMARWDGTNWIESGRALNLS